MIGAVENALVEVLRQAGDSGQLGYVYRTLESYPEEFDAYLKERKVPLRCPAAWAVFLGIDRGDDAEDDAGFMGEARFALVVAAENLRNETATRHGGPGEPGSYQLAIDAVRLLSGNALEPLELTHPVTVEGLRLVARSPEIRKAGLSLVAIALSCTIPFGQFPRDDAPFDTLHVDWDIPAFGNVGPELPAADPDAADQMELPQ